MEKNNESGNIETLFKEIAMELFPKFSSYSSFYTFWCFDFLANKDDTSRKLNALYTKYQKIPEQKDSMQNTTPLYICRETLDSQTESYGDPFSHLTDIKRLQLSQEEMYIKDTAQFHALAKKNYDDEQLWTYFMWKYFVEEQNILYNIIASSYNKRDKTITVSREEFLSLCTTRRNEYEISKYPICEVDKDDFKNRLNLLSNSHPCIKRTTGNKFQYPKSMQDAIIEYVAMPYDKSNTEYLSSSLQSLKKYLKQDKDTLENSKGKQILNWKDDNKYYSFDVFTNANQRLFLKNDVNLKTAENWISLTGSLISNCIYKTLLEVNKHYRFISSRMDNSILEKLYFCLEKSLNLYKFSYIEKMKFIQRIYSLIPLFLERTKSGEASKDNARKKINNSGKTNICNETSESNNIDNPIKRHEKLEAVFQSLANAIEKFNIELIVKNYNKKFKELNQNGLLKTYNSTINKIIENTNMYNKAFVKMYSQSQKGEKDTERSKNALFYQKISKGVIYMIYS